MKGIQLANTTETSDVNNKYILLPREKQKPEKTMMYTAVDHEQHLYLLLLILIILLASWYFVILSRGTIVNRIK